MGGVADKIEIRPCADEQGLRRYIDDHWRRGHVLAHSDAMFAFTYRTPWVDRRAFPSGVSVLTLTDGGRLLGFLGAICAPYPRETSYWLALWHVLPDLKGGGWGGRLLQAMQDLALSGAGTRAMGSTGWIGTFGAGPEALPVYLKRGYAVRAARRWVYDPAADDPGRPLTVPTPRNEAEVEPCAAWLDHRFARHPVYAYETLAGTGTVVRSEENAWGRVTHVVRLSGDARAELKREYERQKELASIAGRPYVMDAWSFSCPGPGWALAAEDLPSVFHPPQARGSTIYAVGLPFVPASIHKGDCDQDRPNTGAAEAHAAHAA